MIHLEKEVKNITSDLKQRQIEEKEIVAQDFKFDRSTLYRDLYISKDGRTISNYNPSEEMEKENGSFLKYQGVRGTKGFSQCESVYNEVDVYYKVLNNITGNQLAFELGFSTKDTIDDAYYLGKQDKSWSLYALRTSSSNAIIICHQVNQGKRYTIKQLSSEVINTTFHGTFAFHVNGPQRKITCFERQDNSLRKLYTFTNVSFVPEIYPVFGVYGADVFNVRLNLKTAKYIKPNIPKELNDFI